MPSPVLLSLGVVLIAGSGCSLKEIECGHDLGFYSDSNYDDVLESYGEVESDEDEGCVKFICEHGYILSCSTEPIENAATVRVYHFDLSYEIIGVAEFYEQNGDGCGGEQTYGDTSVGSCEEDDSR